MCDWSTDDIELIKRHTSYDNDELIIDKLKLHKSAINVIRDSFDIPIQPNSVNTTITTSLNQEIYRQLRNKMDIIYNK